MTFCSKTSLVVRKLDFCICENKDADQLRGYISFAVTAKLISAFVFATRIVQSLYFLNPKFQASGHLLWLYSPVCVRTARKPRRPLFSQRGSNVVQLMFLKQTRRRNVTLRGTFIGVNAWIHNLGCKQVYNRLNLLIEKYIGLLFTN